MKFDLHKFVGILSVVGPVILMLVPGGPALVPFVGLILSGITEAEALRSASGAAKKAHVLKLVEGAITATNLAKPHTVDPALAVEAASQGIDAVISAVNAVQKARIAQPAVPALVPIAP